MQVERITTANGIDDIKLIGETDLEKEFIRHLAEAGTLSCLNRQVSESALFRPISVMSEISSYASSKGSIGKYDFAIRQNQNHNVDLLFNTDGVALDLTQFSSIKLQVKFSKSAPALIELAVGSGLEISGDDSNVLKVAFTAAQTSALSCQAYYYDVLMSKPTSNVYYLEGRITVNKTATR